MKQTSILILFCILTSCLFISPCFGDITHFKEFDHQVIIDHGSKNGITTLTFMLNYSSTDLVNGDVDIWYEIEHEVIGDIESYITNETLYDKKMATIDNKDGKTYIRIRLLGAKINKPTIEYIVIKYVAKNVVDENNLGINNNIYTTNFPVTVDSDKVSYSVKLEKNRWLNTKIIKIDYANPSPDFIFDDRDYITLIWKEPMQFIEPDKKHFKPLIGYHYENNYGGFFIWFLGALGATIFTGIPRRLRNLLDEINVRNLRVLFSNQIRNTYDEIANELNNRYETMSIINTLLSGINFQFITLFKEPNIFVYSIDYKYIFYFVIVSLVFWFTAKSFSNRGVKNTLSLTSWYQILTSFYVNLLYFFLIVLINAISNKYISYGTLIVSMILTFYFGYDITKKYDYLFLNDNIQLQNRRGIIYSSFLLVLLMMGIVYFL